MGKTLPTFTSLDLLRALYTELSAQVRPYWKTIVRVTLKKGGSYEESVVHTSANHNKLDRKGHRGARNVEAIRTFEETTSGSLYAPVSALGYRQMDYEWALNFKIDCDLARQKSGDIADGAAHYIADIAADTHIIKRRQALEEFKPRGRPPTKLNSKDMEERYSKLLKGSDKEEALAWIAQNKDRLDDTENDFVCDTRDDVALHFAVSISAGPEDETDEAFLDWLTKSGPTSNRKQEQD